MDREAWCATVLGVHKELDTTKRLNNNNNKMLISLLITVTDFILGGSKITADSDCSHEIKRRLLLGRKVMTNLDSILKIETLLCQQRSI